MVLKKITLYYLILLSSCFLAQNSNTVLWRISGKNLTAPSYLYGTIHIKDKRVFNVKDSVLNYIQSCNAFATELHPDSLNSLIFSVLSKKDTVADVFRNSLNSKEYDLINKKLQNDLGLSLNQIKNKNFKYLKLLLNPVKQKSDDYPTFLDGYLMAIAKRSNKDIVGLETMQSHEEGLNSIAANDKLKKEVIELSKEEKKSDDVFEPLIKNYLSGNIDKIQENTTLLSYEAQHDLIYIRNKRMAHSIDSIIQTKTLFATCGAAHLGGDNGIIKLLKEMGYTLTPIFPDKKMFLSLSNLPHNYNSWQPISNANLGFSYKLPGVPAAYVKNVVYSDMKMYVDIGTGVSYAVFPFSSAIEINDKQTTYDKFVDALKKKSFGETIKTKKSIAYNGYDGIEIEYQGSSKVDVRVRVFIENNIIYTFIISYPSNTIEKEEFDYFFNSISFYKPVKSDSYLYSNKLWDIEMNLPAKPFEKKDNNYNGSSKSEILSIKASDNIAGIHYLLECTEVGPGRYYTDDSLLLNGIRDRFAEKNSVVSIKDSSFMYQGSRSKQTIVCFDDKSTIVNWTMLRGFKLYNLMAIMSKSVQDKHFHDAIFQSINFSTHDLSDFKSIKTPIDSNLTIKLNEDFKKMPSDNKDEPVIEEKNPVYMSFDSKTAITYYVQKQDEGAYYYSIADSLYWKKVESKIASYDDTVLTRKDLKFNSIKAKEFVVKSKTASALKHYVVLDFGKYQYLIYAYLPANDQNPRILFPLNTINYSGVYKNEIVSDTMAFSKLLKDVYASDSTIKVDSRNELNGFTLTDNMFNQITTVLNSSKYEKDTTENYWFDIKRKLISNMEDLNSDKIFEFVKYKLNDSTTEVENLPLYANLLASIKIKKAYEELNSFFKHHTSDLSDYSSTLFRVRDSLNLAMLLYPNVLESFAKDSNENYSFTLLTELLLDTGLLSYDYLKTYENDLMKRSLSYENQKTDMESVFDTYYGDGILQLLNYSPNKDVIYSYFNKLCKSKNVWCAYYGSYYLLKNKQPLNAKLIESLASNPFLRNYLYNDYKLINRLDVFPTKYFNQYHLAEADLYNSAYDASEVEITKVDFIKKMQVQYEGKDAEFYIYKTSYNGGKESYLAFAGPYYVGEEISNSGLKTGIYFDEEYVKGLEEEYYQKFILNY